MIKINLLDYYIQSHFTKDVIKKLTKSLSFLEILTFISPFIDSFMGKTSASIRGYFIYLFLYQ